jgi:hypothetical protein
MIQNLLGCQVEVYSKEVLVDSQSIVTLIVGAIAAILGLVYRYYKPLDPVKSWLEMGLSVIGAIVVAFAVGKVPALPGGDPVKTIQYFLEIGAVIFTFVKIIYAAAKQAAPTSTLIVRALGK